MASKKAKGNRVQVILECTHHGAGYVAFVFVDRLEHGAVVSADGVGSEFTAVL